MAIRDFSLLRSSDGDRKAFQRRRATEFKHGRIAMLATMGYILSVRSEKNSLNIKFLGGIPLSTQTLPTEKKFWGRNFWKKSVFPGDFEGANALENYEK